MELDLLSRTLNQLDDRRERGELAVRLRGPVASEPKKGGWRLAQVGQDFVRLEYRSGDVMMPPVTALAQADFVVRDMRVEGLQRISEGTVFNYLPINIGDIRNLCNQSLYFFFREVQQIIRDLVTLSHQMRESLVDTVNELSPSINFIVNR